MKKYLLCFFALSALNFSKAQSSLPNASFENWYDLNVKDSLDFWNTSTNENQSSGNMDVNNSYQISNAYMGASAIHLETVLDFNEGTGLNDTVIGFAVNQIADGSGFYGFPYVDTVDLFTCWYKSNIGIGDFGLVLIELSKAGVVYSQTAYPISGVQSTWTQLNIPLVDGDTQEPDSVFVGFASSDPFNPGVAKPGSWIEIDLVSFSFLAGDVIPAPIPNNSFEDWTYESIEQPNDWFSFDQLLYNMLGTNYVHKSTDASHGLHSLEIETTFENLMMGVPSFVTNGTFNTVLDSLVGGTPFIAQPGQISGMYQFDPAFTDTAFVIVDFWNATTGLHQVHIDTLHEALVWTPWSIDLSLSEAPDSVLVYILGGANLGSTLWIDNISFSGGDLGVTTLQKADWNIYPNPANEYIELTPENADVIRIFDMNGRLIKLVQVETLDQTCRIQTQEFETGTYILQVIHQGKTSSKSFQVIH